MKKMIDDKKITEKLPKDQIRQTTHEKIYSKEALNGKSQSREEQRKKKN